MNTPWKAMHMHGTEEPSAWVIRWTHLLPLQSQVLDLACGAGRHMRWFAAHGHHCTGVDRSPEALAEAKAHGHVMTADIEGDPWPLEGQTFDAVIVTNYLWRPLMPRILECLKPQGILIYETFALGHETIGKPSRPDFLLKPGELLQTCAAMHVIAYEDGYSEQPPKFVQRIVATPQVPPSGHPIGLGCR
jgi:SAM-dependent methyltransferase